MAEIEELIKLRHPLPEWATILELNKGTGWKGVEGRIDAVAFNCYPSKGLLRIAFEVKRSRHDFMRELEKPAKREWVEKSFHQTYFVAPPNIIKEAELPEGWGLMVATATDLKRVVAAKHRDVGPMPEPIALSAIRKLAEMLHVDRSARHVFEGEEITQDQINEKVERAIGKAQAAIDEKKRELAKLEHGLKDDRSRLEAPLAALAHAAHDYQVFQSWKKDPYSVTGEDVRKWVQAIRLTAIKNLLGGMREVRDQIDRVLDMADDENLKNQPTPDHRRLNDPLG